jgi:hypothetical protein
MSRRSTLVAFLFLFFTPAAFSRDHWICLRSANFELFTTSDEATGRGALVFFEQVRRAYTEVLGIKLPENKPVTIVAFRDEQAFAPYRPQVGVAAFSMSLPQQDFIVMQDLDPAHYPIALHEFTHVIISQAGLKLPLWLNEGFAELYATLTPVGHKIRLGRILPARLQVAQGGLIDLHEVLTADRASKLYHENDRVGIFYAESWSLVHMLKFSDAYAPRFDRFLDAIGRGEGSEAALQSVYGKTTLQIQLDLQRYVHGPKFREGVIKAKLDKPVAPPEVVPLDPVDMTVLLAGLEARGPRRPLAVKTLEELAAEHPDKLAPVEALAWIQLSGSDARAAVEPFRKALALGTRDGNLCLTFASKLRAAVPDADYVAALRRAAELDPASSQVQEALAAHAFDAHDYAEVVAHLHQVKKLEKSNAFQYYRMLSAAESQLGHTAEAKAAAARAEQFAPPKL